jgi:hypothetical protein
MPRRKLAGDTLAELQKDLCEVLNHTLEYLDCPLSLDEMSKVWHAGIAPELIAAHDTLAHAGLISPTTGYTRTVSFVLPELQAMVRWNQARDSQQYASAFFKGTIAGPHGAENVNVAGAKRRVVRMEEFNAVLPPARVSEFKGWCIAACAVTERQNVARNAIRDISKMLSTPGQLNRMVPELVQYLPARTRIALADQTRKSPYPPLWAAFDKSRVETMLACLAEGHLCKGMGKRKVWGVDYEFSWAQSLPVGNCEVII